MTIRLNPELEEFIDQQVRAGKFESAEAAVAAAVEQMRQYEEKIVWLRREIQIGIDELNRGEGKPWDFEGTKNRIMQRLEEARVERCQK